MRVRPPKKAAVPRAFCLRAKKRRVFCGPIIIVRPMRKRTWGWRVSFAVDDGRSEGSAVSQRGPGWEGFHTFPMASLVVEDG